MALVNPDPAAAPLDRIYRQYREELRRFFAGKVRSAAAVDDLVQSVFLGLLNRRASTRIQDLEKYLFKIAWNVLHAQNQRNAYERCLVVHIAPDELEEKVAANSHLWMDDSTTLADQANLIQTLLQLDRVKLDVFFKYRIENLTQAQIAQVTGLHTSTVKKYLAHVLVHLRAHYGNSIQPER